MNYNKMLQDPRWQKKRLRILDRDDWSCVVCKNTKMQLHVHHIVYRKGARPWEYPDQDLESLCRLCHEAIHLFEWCKGIVVPWCSDGQFSDLEVLFFTGEKDREFSKTKDVIWYCKNIKGEEVFIDASCGWFCERPENAVGSAFFKWIKDVYDSCEEAYLNNEV